MRIMFVSDQYPPMIGGVPKLTRGLASDLVKRRHQVWVIAPNYGVRDSQRVEQGVHVSRFTSIEWPTYREQRLPFFPFAPVYSLLKECNLDVIHSHSYSIACGPGEYRADPGGTFRQANRRHQPLPAY